MSKRIIVWFRRDLRLADNPALTAACSEGVKVVPLFIWSPKEEHPWEPGGASRWWLHHSLLALERTLNAAGTSLVIRQGEALTELLAVAEEAGATAVFWNRLYEPYFTIRDSEIKTALNNLGIEAKSFHGNLLIEPWNLQNSSGKPFRVFTPFWKKLGEVYVHQSPLVVPKKIPPGLAPLRTATVEQLKLLDSVDWASGLRETWQPSEGNANKLLQRFLSDGANNYHKHRDRPDLDGTSRLSPFLHFGQITPRQIWHNSLRPQRAQGFRQIILNIEPFLRQLGWREFACHLLFHYPETAHSPLRPEFKKFPWRRNQDKLQRWQRGETGYPLVDAGMRELWHTGAMHNRVRMVVASFLVKHLLQPWQEGAKWFWDTLVDADLANNTLGWQWTAGCGADAAPYFRVFNPTIQGEKFDPEGEYVKRWVPELARLSKKWIHRPAGAPDQVLQNAGIMLGKNYPYPIVDHQEAREDALDAYEEIRSPAKDW